MRNIFGNIPNRLPEESFEDLIRENGFVLERIVSRGHATAAGEWLEQETAEWVILLSGRAVLEFAEGERLELAPGDYLLIDPGERHRVAWTDPEKESVWLALHYHDRGEELKG